MTSGDRFAWEAYTLPDVQANFAPGAVVIDVGCGNGKELKQLAERGCVAIGLDVDPRALADCRQAELPVVLAPAEHMPLRAQAFDGLICNVAIPYTDESRVMQEIGRILKGGGARISVLPWVRLFSAICGSRPKLPDALLRSKVGVQYLVLPADRKPAVRVLG